MRPFVPPLLVLALLSLSPLAPAAQRNGETVGVDYGVGDAGLWDLHYFRASGGHTGISVQWDVRFPPADYDVYVYPHGSFNGRTLTGQPIAMGETESFAGEETLWLDLAPGVYEVVVIPRQSTMNGYRLFANPGTFDPEYWTFVGVRVFVPEWL